MPFSAVDEIPTGSCIGVYETETKCLDICPLLENVLLLSHDNTLVFCSGCILIWCLRWNDVEVWTMLHVNVVVSLILHLSHMCMLVCVCL